ncbi:CPBP family intramembrane glutamic endopeptidase [Nitrosopumilus sp.]|uniref:CPBP family intramembrane glutamic endopeptidase n=1 Tax=Nitrosopumilus sp. TaxID=2024843 RepID=UPI0026301024|nr:CPBP family intramembrane glutamic endopeptidase [Nitrosopumilus sp.]
MESSNKILQALGIPYSAILSVLFGLLLVSLPIGVFVVFDSEIGNDINYEFPISHLELFEGTDFYQSSIDVSIGDAFVVLWTFYVIIFVIAILGPKHNFLESLSPIISRGQIDSSNYMLGITKWFSILVFASAIVTYLQDWIGIPTTPPMAENELIQFFYVSLAPLIEEFGFRILLIGIPLFMMYSRRTSLKFFVKSLWHPSNLDIIDSKKAILLIVFVGVLFGFAHIAFGESWSEGKFAQASIGGIILGWAYLRYGFVASLLIHWATNYFIFAYANFVSQVNSISIENAFTHSLMSSLELLLLVSGGISLTVLLVNRFYSKREPELEV